MPGFSVLGNQDSKAQEPQGHRPLYYEETETKLLKNTVELI